MGTDQQSVCSTKEVAVEGKQAAWIFAEFQSGATIRELSSWLDPENWHRWGPKMFDSVTLIGDRPTVTDRNGKRWHGKYMEVASIGGRNLHTVLQCDGKETSNWAAMTYDLDHSVGDVLTVDRGFLLAVDIGKGSRLVKALKIVGFADTVDNALATTLCPLWLDWMKKATSTAAKQVDGSPVGETHGALGDSGPGDGAAAEAATGFTRGYAREWADRVSDMAEFYGTYATDVTNRLWSGDYGRKDAAEDSSRLFLRLARDWSQLWKAGNIVAEGFAGSDVPPTGGVSGGGGWTRSVEYSTVLVPAPKATAAVTVSDLSRLGVKKATIKAGSVKVTPSEIGGGASEPVAVRLLTDTTGMPAGMYEGELQIGPDKGGPDKGGPDKGGPDKAAGTTAPALFYVSGARPLSKKG